MSPNLRILDINCCGFPVFAPGMKARFSRLAKEIAKLEPDILCLQEVFFKSHFEIFKSHFKDLPYSFAYFRAGVFPAGGLAVFSRLKAQSFQFIPYKEQGGWLGYTFFARLSKKGILAVRFEDPPLRVVNTHLVANYIGDWTGKGAYLKFQVKQLSQMIEFLKTIEEDKIPTIVAGDFNFPPDSFLYKKLKEEASLQDVLADDGPTSAGRWARKKPTKDWRPKRIDYIFVEGFKGVEAKAQLVFQEYIWSKGRKDYLADHCGILAELKQ